MGTEKCKEMMDRMLSGEHSEELTKHLRECPECRELAELDRQLSGMPEHLAVPEELDRAVLAYAAAKKRPAVRILDFPFILRHAVIPIAAAVMVCFGLVFAFRSPVNPPRQPMAWKSPSRHATCKRSLQARQLLVSHRNTLWKDK